MCFISCIINEIIHEQYWTNYLALISAIFSAIKWKLLGIYFIELLQKLDELIYVLC